MVKGARFLRGWRTLDECLPSPILKGEGKDGPRGLRGLAPWRSMRQRLMRANGALPPAASIFFRAPLFQLRPIPPVVCHAFGRHASIRTLGLRLYTAGALWCPRYEGVLPSRDGLRATVGRRRRSAKRAQSPRPGAIAYSVESADHRILYAATLPARCSLRLYCGS